MSGSQKEDVRGRLDLTEKIALKRCDTIKDRFCQIFLPKIVENDLLGESRSNLVSIFVFDNALLKIQKP